MSTMVPIPVRVKPPPAEMGEIISPGCAFLATTTPVKGARITVSSSCCCQTATCRAATPTSSRWRSSRAASESAAARARSSSASLAISCCTRFSTSPLIEAGFGEQHLGLRQRALGGSELGLGETERDRNVGVVQAGEDLPVFHDHPFLDKDFYHLAGDLGGDSRLPPGGHIAGGVEHRATGTHPDFAGDRGSHFGYAGPAREPPGHGGYHQHSHDDGDDPPPPR